MSNIKKNKWQPFLITKDFLYLYLQKLGVNDRIDIDRIVDLNDISNKSKNKFLFAISKLKTESFFTKTEFPYYTETNPKKFPILYPKIAQEIEEDPSLNFLSLLLTGFCNCSYKQIFEENSILESTINKIKGGAKESQNLSEDNYFNSLNRIYFDNEEISKIHNEIVNEIFGGSYDDILRREKKEKEEKILQETYEMKSALIGATRENESKQISNLTYKLSNYNLIDLYSDSYSIFFVHNLKLYEFIPKYRTLAQIKTEQEFMTEGNICENLETYVMSNLDRYYDDIFIFSELNKLPKETSLSFNLFNFFILILSTLLLIVNFFFVSPQNDFIVLNKLYNHVLTTDAIASFYDIKNKKIKQILETIFTDINNNKNNYNFIQNQNYNKNPSKDDSSEDGINKINTKKIYINDVNYFCGMLISFSKGKEDNELIYKTKSSYEKVKPSLISTKDFDSTLYYPPNLKKTPMYMLSEELQLAFTDNLYDINLSLLFFNGNKEILSNYEIKFTIETSGEIKEEHNYKGLKPYINFRRKSIGMFILNIIYMLILLYMAASCAKVFIEKISFFCENHIFDIEFDDVVDFCVMCFCVASEVIFCMQIYFKKKEFNLDNIKTQGEFEYWTNQMNRNENYLIVTGFSIFLQCIRVSLFIFKFFPSFNMLINPIAKGIYEFCGTILVLLLMIIFIAVISFGVYSGTIKDFSSFPSGFISTLGMMNELIDSSLLKIDTEKEIIFFLSIFFFVIIVYFLYMKVFYVVYRMRYEKEITKRLLSTQAINRIYFDKLMVFLTKVYCLFVCKSYSDYNREINERKKMKKFTELSELDQEGKVKEENKDKLKKEHTLQNEEIIFFSQKKESVFDIFITNFKNLDLLNFFRKTNYTPEELSSLKKEKYYKIRKQNIRDDLAEIGEDLGNKFDLFMSCIFFIIFIVLFTVLLDLINKPNYQQKINNYFQSLDQFKENEQYIKFEEVDDKIKKFIDDFYVGSNVDEHVPPFRPENYAFVSPYFMRATIRLFSLEQQSKSFLKSIFPFGNKKTLVNTDLSNCPTETEVKGNYNFINGEKDYIQYTKSGSENSINKCGGYVFWFSYNNPLDGDSTVATEETETLVDEKYKIYIANKAFKKYLDYALKENLGSIIFDLFYVSKESDFMVYIKVAFIRQVVGGFEKKIDINAIPINRFLSSKDFSRFVLEGIYLFILIVMSFQELFVYCEILLKLIRKDFDEQDAYIKQKFRNSSEIAKFYRIDWEKYSALTKCVLCYTAFDILSTVIIRTVYLIFLLVKSFVLYIYVDIFNLFDFISLTISFSMIGLMVKIAYKTENLLFIQHEKLLEIPVEKRFGISVVNELSILYDVYTRWQSINAILIFLRLIQNFKFSRSVNLLIGSIMRNFGIIIADVLIFIIINYGFGLFAYSVLSQKIDSFSEIGIGFINLMMLISGKQTPAEVLVKNNFFSVVIFCIIFFIINFCIIFNILFGVLHFGFFDMKRREKLYFQKTETNYFILIYEILIKAFEKQKKNAEIVVNKILSENIYESNWKNKIESVYKETSSNRGYKSIINDFFSHLFAEISKKTAEYYEDFEDSLINKIFVYIGLFLGEEENKEEIEKNENRKREILSKFRKEQIMFLKNNKKDLEEKNSLIQSVKEELNTDLPSSGRGKAFENFLNYYKNEMNLLFFKPNIFDKFYEYQKREVKEPKIGPSNTLKSKLGSVVIINNDKSSLAKSQVSEGKKNLPTQDNKSEKKIEKDNTALVEEIPCEDKDKKSEKNITNPFKDNDSIQNTKEIEQINIENENTHNEEQSKRSKKSNSKKAKKKGFKEVQEENIEEKEEPTAEVLVNPLIGDSSSNHIKNSNVEIINDFKTKELDEANKIRIYRTPRINQDPLSFDPSKSFLTESPFSKNTDIYSFPCIEEQNCYKDPPCEHCIKMGETLTQISQRMFDLCLKFFLSPREGKNDTQIFLGYHLSNYLISEKDRFSIHFAKEFLNYITSEFVKEFLKIAPKEEEEKSKEYSLSFISKKVNFLHKFLYKLLSSEELKSFSSKYQEIIKSKPNQSPFSQIFSEIHNLNKENPEDNIQKIFSFYHMDKSYLTLKKAIIQVYENENLKNAIDSNLIFSSEFLFYANEENFKYIINIKERKQYSNEYLNQEVFPLILSKIWSSIDNETSFNLFYGYNNLLDSKKPQKISPKEVNSKIYSSKPIDVYKYFTSTEKANLVTMMKFSECEMEIFTKKFRAFIENKKISINSEEIRMIKTELDFIKLFHMKKVNFVYQNEFIISLLKSGYETIKEIVNKKENEYYGCYAVEGEASLYFKAAVEKFVELIKSKEKFESIKDFLVEKEKSELINRKDKKNVEFSQVNNDPIYEIPEKAEIEDYVDQSEAIEKIKESQNKKKLRKINHPLLFFCSLSKFEMIDTIQEMKNIYAKQFFSCVFQFIYGVEQDVVYYLRRRIKIDFIEKLYNYLDYITLFNHIEAKKEKVKFEEEEIEDAMKYLNIRAKDYDVLYKNLIHEKEEMEKEPKNS